MSLLFFLPISVLSFPSSYLPPLRSLLSSYPFHLFLLRYGYSHVSKSENQEYRPDYDMTADLRSICTLHITIGSAKQTGSAQLPQVQFLSAPVCGSQGHVYEVIWVTCPALTRVREGHGQP